MSLDARRACDVQVHPRTLLAPKGAQAVARSLMDAAVAQGLRYMPARAFVPVQLAAVFCICAFTSALLFMFDV